MMGNTDVIFGAVEIQYQFEEKYSNDFRRNAILSILQQFVQQINLQCIPILLVWSKTEKSVMQT